jgi:gas vesicle protein
MRHASHTASYNNGGGHSSLAFIAGIAVGVAVGMLFAPSPGGQLRSKLSDGAQRLGRRTADTYNDAAHMMSDWVERGRSATEAGREAFRRARSSGAETQDGADV